MTSPDRALETALGTSYTLERELGRGGMATVYLARDLRHRRQVAVKVLHRELSAVLGPERFLKEIELTASLQHPHILPLFDSGSAEGLLYYVMPFVEGESLRQRLERERQLPVDEAVRLAREVAGALAYAHGRGVIHRDIKPENILLQGGHALVADFGIALAVQHAGGARMTQTGLSLGTPQYMSPEQAMGDKTADARADLYALAAVLYEMLVGEPPFTGPTSQAIVARVMTESPRSVRAQRPTVSPHVDAAVHTGLEKLPADRFPSVAAFAAALAEPIVAHAAPATRAAPATAPRGGLFPLTRGRAAMLAAGALAAGAALGWGIRPERTTAIEPVRFAVEPDSGTLFALTTPAISPEGRAIVYAALGTGGTRLYVRSVGDLVARPIVGTEDAESAFFSPDGAWVAFYANGAIRKIRLDGGSSVLVANVPSMTIFCGGAWGPNDTILYINQLGQLFRVSAGGGTPSRVALADSTLHVWAARALPGGRTLLVNVAESADPGRIGVLDLESGRVKEFGAAYGAHYVAGYLVYADEDGGLFRRPFDLDKLQPTGPEEQIASNVAFDEGRLGRVGLGLSGVFPSFDVSASGALVYRMAPISTLTSQLIVFDSTGRALETIAGREPWAPRFSRDGRRVAYGAFAPGSARSDARDLWVTDLETGTTQRVTTDARDNNDPHWSPDERSLVFSRLDTGSRKELGVQPLDGGVARRLTVQHSSLRPGTEWPSDWSQDGHVLFTHVTTDGEMDLWVESIAGDTARPYLATAAREFGARVSPDGKWVAYTSNETGHPEVYIQPYPMPGPKTPVSVGGGNGPVWRGDSRVLYFWQWQTGQLFAARLEGGRGSPLSVRKPTRLFSAPYIENFNPNYDVSRDGTRFVVVTGPALPNRLVVELNVLGSTRAGRVAGR